MNDSGWIHTFSLLTSSGKQLKLKPSLNPRGRTGVKLKYGVNLHKVTGQYWYILKKSPNVLHFLFYSEVLSCLPLVPHLLSLTRVLLCPDCSQLCRTVETVFVSDGPCQLELARCLGFRSACWSVFMSWSSFRVVSILQKNWPMDKEAL